MAKGDRTFIGLYCGPSADGADAAVVEIAGSGEAMSAKLGRFLHRPMPEELRARVLSAASGWATAPAELAKLDREVGDFLAATCEAALRKARLLAKYVSGVGLMGHAAAYVEPTLSSGLGSTIELGSPATVARGQNLPVVSGFAASDLAAGGVGGPVWAWPDWLLFHDGRLSRVVVQLGAIASITFVPANASARDVIAFDVGPGTSLVDGLARQLYEREMDADGTVASRGSLHLELLHELQTAEFFHRDAPKRTHLSQWGNVVLQRLEMMAGKHRCPAADLMTTVTELTARTIARDVLDQTERPHEVILTGGGAKNIHLASRIRTLLSPCSTYAAERYALDVRSHAAVCCAILAAARMDGFAAHCCGASGAKGPVPLGALWMP